MQQTCLIFLCIAIVLSLVASSPAEIKRHRHRHHGKHHKKSQEDYESPNDDHKHTLPPNIWALLASNKSDDDNGSKSSDGIEPSHDLNEIADNVSDFDPDEADDESINKKVAANCPKCKKNSVKMSESELANLRIEYVKNQILHKLRMTERPAPVFKDELPEPIQEGYVIQGDDDPDYEFLNRHLDDYFAKTTQKIIFLTQGK